MNAHGFLTMRDGFRQRTGLLAALLMTALMIGRPAARADESEGTCGPKYMHVEPETGKLLVACEKGDSVLRIDPQKGAIEARTATGAEPYALCPHPDGDRLYVTCRRGQEVLELSASSLQILRRFPLRGDPTGIAVSADGTRLYVGVHSLDQVAVIDVEAGRVTKRLVAGNGPGMVRSAPHTGRVYVTNLLSNPVSPDQPPRNEITVIDDATARVVDRVILENANIGRWIAFNSDASLAVVAISRPKNLIPMVQVARGWVVTNGFAILFPEDDAPPVQLLVDLPNRAFSDPFGVAIAPDEGKLYLTCAGADQVVAVDLPRLRKVTDEALAGQIPHYADDLGLSRRHVTARIAVGANPEALAFSPDGGRLYVANRLDDSISVIDTAKDRTVATLRISQPGEPDKYARGERLFHSAARTFQGQFSCASCHPDRGFDGLQYDLEPDGMGDNILDNRNMRAVGGTEPFKWNGKNPDITTQCGTRTAKWIVRTGWLTSMEVVELAAYIRSIEPVVNPHRAPDASLTAAQRRGKALFDRVAANDGSPIPARDRCVFCHPGPTFTDRRRHDVGTMGPGDTVAEFDSAHLTNTFESAPYLHDGRAATLEEIWTKHNPGDKHGISSDWNKQQLNDLIEYLKCL